MQPGEGIGADTCLPAGGEVVDAGYITSRTVAAQLLLQPVDLIERRLGGTGSEAGNPAVVVSIQKNPGTNTLELTERLDVALDSAEASAPKGIKINRFVMRQSDFIGVAVSKVMQVLLEASIFVAILLILFLMNVRTTFITLTAIPLSLVMTAVVFAVCGMSINTMTLGGLAVALGELVDDAIVDVENIFRRLKENRLAPNPKSTLLVVFQASTEVRNSIVFSTMPILSVS